MPNVQANPNWRRWTKKSLWKTFVATFSGSGYQLVIDGQSFRPANPETDKGKLEFRIDGPITKTHSKTSIRTDWEVNIHGQVYHRDGFLNEVDQIMGLVMEWLGQDHCVYRLGSNVQDDGTLVGGLEFQVEGRLDGVKPHYLGHEEGENFTQFSVEAPFKMVLEQGD